MDPKIITKVKKIARGLSRGKSKMHFDDLVQEGLLGIWLSNEVVDVNNNIIFTIAKRKMIDYIRKEYGHRNTNTKINANTISLTKFTFEGNAFGYDVSDYNSINDTFEILNLLEKVPEESKVLIIAVSEGWTLKEIGNLWGITESRASQIRSIAKV